MDGWIDAWMRMDGKATATGQGLVWRHCSGKEAPTESYPYPAQQGGWAAQDAWTGDRRGGHVDEAGLPARASFSLQTPSEPLTASSAGAGLAELKI